jgi:hypothetical protein
MPGRPAPLTVCSSAEGAAVARALKLRWAGKRFSRFETGHANGRLSFGGSGSVDVACLANAYPVNVKV